MGPLADGISNFRDEWDNFLPSELAESGVPLNREEFSLRDPFSEDYSNFRQEQSDNKRANESVDDDIRADLLEKPFLMKNPVEEGARGAAAVWRSLRDQLHEETLLLIDSSGETELQMLRRELLAQKAIVEAVSLGLKAQLDRLDSTLSAIVAENSNKKSGVND